MRNQKYKTKYERIDLLKKLHICTYCGKEDAEPNSIYCFECKEKHNKKQREKYKTIKNRKNHYDKEKYYEFKEKGICTKCHHKKICNKSLTLCLECYIKAYKYRNKKKQGTISRVERASYGLCYICGNKKEIEDKKICNKCLKRLRENAKINPKFTERKGEYFKKQNKLFFIKNTRESRGMKYEKYKI